MGPRNLPPLLKLSGALMALQAASALAIAAVGLSYSASQRATIDQISSVNSLGVFLASAVAGIVIAVLVVMLARRMRPARWVTVTLEMLILLCGVLLIPVAVTTGFFNLENLWITLATVPAPALILFGLLVDRGVRSHFRSTVATSGLSGSP
jgi:cell division protein FtsW (lipid II flippase)